MDEKVDLRDYDILLPDEVSMLKEFNEGKPIGELAHIEGIEDQFTWKRTFVNCWTGRPNSGKSTLLEFMALVKSKADDWKWCLWSPEMINSHKIGNLIHRSSSDIYDELIHMLTGKNPYKHFVDKYNIPQMKQEEYLEALMWVQDRIIVIDPKEKSYKNLIDTYNYLFEKYGFDGWIIDPFKNVRYEQTGTTDVVLHHIFDEFKYCAVHTNSSINIVAHPRSLGDSRDARIGGKENGAYKPVNQFHLLGGSAWDNAMDGIFSVYRPNIHQDPNDRRAWLYHYKQRKKHLVGETGVYKHIEFDKLKNRFYFDGRCPLDPEDFLTPIEKEGTDPDAMKKAVEKDQQYIEFKNTDYDQDKAPF